MPDPSASGLAALRRWLQPVTTEELPDLPAKLLTASRVFAVTFLISNSMLLAVVVTVPEGERLAWIGGVATVLAMSLVALAVSWTPVGRARPALLMHGLIVGVPYIGILSPLASSGMEVYCPALLLAISTFVPWRPTNSLALVPVLALLPVLLHQTGGELPIPVSIYVAMTAISGAIAALSNQFQRRLLARLWSTQSKLIAGERMSSLGKMTAGVAHELKTPLAAARNELAQIKTLTAELADSVGDPEVTTGDLQELAADLSQSTRASVAALERAGAFIAAIRGHTQMMDDERSSFSVADRCADLRLLLAHRLKKSGISLETHVDDRAQIEGNPRRFDQILTNLLTNAVEACEEKGGSARVEVRATAKQDGVELVVQDDGPGVPAELRAEIFEPLFTTRGSNQGTGLGLAIANDIVRGDFGGTLRLVDSERGARFVAHFPQQSARLSTSPQAWVPAVGRAPHGGARGA